MRVLIAAGLILVIVFSAYFFMQIHQGHTKTQPTSGSSTTDETAEKPVGQRPAFSWDHRGVREPIPALAPPEARREFPVDRSDPFAARHHREFVLDRLKNSGKDSSSNQMSEAIGAVQKIQEAIGSSTGIRMSSPDCFTAGCFFTIDFSNESAYQTSFHALPALVKERWSGPTFVAGPDRLPDGSVTTSVVLYTG